ncbi:UNVERIFIED_CONTAM: hypothetical protein K2H54_000498 [Gekko kuhli]
MDLLTEDIKFIIDETLDFGLFSPSDGLEEDLVTCPSEPSERNLTQTIDMNTLFGESGSKAREWWRSLSPEKLEEVRKEANMLAAQMEKCRLLQKENSSSDLRPEKVPGFEPFSPIRFLRAENEGSKNSRRKTFNVSNSPLIALLPTVGPETHLARDSPGVRFPMGRSPTPHIAKTPSSKTLQNKTNSCSAGSQLFKKNRPRNSPSVSPTMMPHSGKKESNRCSRKGRPSPLALPGTTKNQNLLLDFRPALQTTKRGLLRKMEKVSGQACSAQDPELKLQDSPCKDTVPVAHGKGKLKPRVYPSQTSSGKKSCPVQEMVPLQKANASQAKTMGGNIPQPRASSKSPHSSSCQTQTRSIPTSALATKLPVPVLRSIPKTTSPVTVSGRHVVPGRPSQLNPLSLGLSGGKGSSVLIQAGKTGKKT